MKLALRDLFWLVLLVAIGVSWRVERQQIQLAYANARPVSLSHYLSGNRFGTVETESRVFREFSNEQLTEYLPNAKGHHSYTAYLLEMSQRRMSDALRGIYAAEKQEPSLDPNDPPNTPARIWDNRNLLTALRRAEGHPDPVRIEIQALGRDPQQCVTSSPFIIPRIVNVDMEQEPIYFEDAYQDQWWIRLTNSRGDTIRESMWLADIRGGLFTAGMLPYGQSEVPNLVFDVREYLEPPPPAKYSLELLHSKDIITGGSSLAGKFIWKSAPIPVIVEDLSLPSKWHSLRLPLVIIGAVLLIGCGPFVRRYLVQESLGKSFLNRRDALALTLIVLLAAAWGTDAFRLK